MPDDRLAELLRQRALLSQHLAWLDSEIAKASGAPLPSVPQAIPLPAIPPEAAVPPAVVLPISGIAPAATPATTLTEVSLPAEPAEPQSEAVIQANKRADEIIANYSATDRFDPNEAKRGCIVLAAGVFVIGATILIGIYLFNYR